MTRKKTIKKKVRLGVTCQCKDPAVTPPPPILRKTQCRFCGKIFKTNREKSSSGDICLDCKRKK